MKFLDEAKIFIKSGPGGQGCMSFRREKYVEFGGPDGGDGGRGGHIYVECVNNLNTLIDYRYQQHFKAQKGRPGMGANCAGAAGKDIVLKAPVGTQIFDESREFLLADLTTPGEKILLLEGGQSGAGNTRFKSSTNRAPRKTTPGGEGKEMWIWLKLKLIADAGLVGLPNAGKSTFLAATSRARPKIADYPFTTLKPQLGVVGVNDREFVLADIPGLIEGAHQGIGIGDKFLGHVERCSVLFHLVDATSEDVAADYQTVLGEMQAYGMGLTDKPQIIGLNKCDALADEEIAEKLAVLKAAADHPVLPLSGVSKKGVPEVLSALIGFIEQPEKAVEETAIQKADAPWSPL